MSSVDKCLDYTSAEMMTVTAARALENGMTCFVGIGLPSEAANLARLTHAPDVVLIYESGTLQTKPDVLPLSIGDGELAETALTTVSVPEMFRYWLQGGKINVGFLGTAQIDRYCNLNTTLIGDYREPKVRLPGGGGAPRMAKEYVSHLNISLIRCQNASSDGQTRRETATNRQGLLIWAAPLLEERATWMSRVQKRSLRMGK